MLDENNQPVYENDKQVFDFIPHETAGVVADNDWTNLYIKNNGLHVVGENYTNDPVTHDGIGISLVAYDTAVGDGTQNSSLMPKDDAQLDGDTSNSKLFNAYYAAQQQQEIKLTLTNLDSFADSAPCDVYVYLGGDQQNTDTYNYLFDVCGHQVGGDTPDQHYYLNDWTGSHFDGDYRRVKRETAPTAAELLSQVAPDMSLVGNYVVFRCVSSSTCEVRIRNLFTDTNQWPLNLPVITAVQVVAGVGLARVITARGVLLCWVRMEAELIADCVVIPASAWNFHPQGAFCSEACSAEVETQAAALRRLNLLALALDPSPVSYTHLTPPTSYPM